MKTKVLYVLVSSDKDIYLEQAFISISSLRHHMGHDVNINVLTDTITLSTLSPKREKMLDEVNEIISIDLPEHYSPQNRSRILKTSCRKYIKGDFLFIDCDTIILKSLESIDYIEADIAACYDSHTQFPQNPYRHLSIPDCKKLGVDISKEEIFYNSGVIYVKDSPVAHQFFELWNKNWLMGREKGVNMDQPAFAKTNIELNYIVSQLSDEWNCEFIHGIRFLKDAKILHYLCTNKSPKPFQEAFILREYETLMGIKRTQKIEKRVQECFDDPFKGIPPLTTIIAGDENYFLRTPLYKSLSFHANSRAIKWINTLLLKLNKIRHK